MSAGPQQRKTRANTVDFRRPMRMSERLHLLMATRVDLAIELYQSTTDLATRLFGNELDPDFKGVNGATAKMTLIALGEYHGENGLCYPGMNALGAVSCCDKRTAQRAVRVLERLRLVTVDDRSRLKSQSNWERTNWYTLHWGQIEIIGRLEISESELTGRQIVMRSDGKLSGAPVTDCHPRGRQIVTQNAHIQTHSTKRASGADAGVDSALKSGPDGSSDLAALRELETELLTAGISGDPLRELLALHPFLTANMVRTEWERCREHGKGTGILIANLKSRAEGRRRKLERTSGKAA